MLILIKKILYNIDILYNIVIDINKKKKNYYQMEQF